jgi:hypothetical protein
VYDFTEIIINGNLKRLVLVLIKEQFESHVFLFPGMLGQAKQLS